MFQFVLCCFNPNFERCLLGNDFSYLIYAAQGETSVLRAWCLRPSLTWKEGKWVEWSSLDQNKHFSQEVLLLASHNQLN